MNSVRSNSLSLKYQGFPPLGCQDIRIRKFEFVAKTQFLYFFPAIVLKKARQSLIKRNLGKIERN